MNENGQGLAAQAMQQEAQGQGQMPTVEQIIQLLMEGRTPEELIQAGVPQELVEQAMMIIQQEMQAQQQAPQNQGGLAAMAGR